MNKHESLVGETPEFGEVPSAENVEQMTPVPEGPEGMLEDQLGHEIEPGPEKQEDEREIVEAAVERIGPMTKEEAEAEAKLYHEELEAQRKEFIEGVASMKLTAEDLKLMQKELDGVLEHIDTEDPQGSMDRLQKAVESHYGNPDEDTVRSALGREGGVGSVFLAQDLWSAWKAEGDERDENLKKAYVQARRMFPPIAIVEAELDLKDFVVAKVKGDTEVAEEAKQALRDLAMDVVPIAKLLGTDKEKKRALAEVRVVGTAVADMLTAYVVAGAVTGAGVAAAGAEVAGLRTFTSGFNEGVKGLQAKAEANPDSVTGLDLLRLTVQEGVKASGKAPKELVVLAGQQFEKMSQDDTMDPERRAQMEGLAQLVQKNPELVLKQIERLDSEVQQLAA